MRQLNKKPQRLRLIRTGKQLALKCAALALDKKALNRILLDVRPWQSIMDYILICSATSQIQAQSICKHIRDTLKNEKLHTIGIEGISGGKWILMDYGDVVIHIFYEYIREFYDLEGLWHQAPRIRLPRK